MLPEGSTAIVQTLEIYTETVKSNVSEQINQPPTEIHAEEKEQTILNLNTYDQNHGKDCRTDISQGMTTTQEDIDQSLEA